MVASNVARYKGRAVTYTDTIEQAISGSEDVENQMVFIHTGTYKGEYLGINSNVIMIGAGTSCLLV